MWVDPNSPWYKAVGNRFSSPSCASTLSQMLLKKAIHVSCEKVRIAARIVERRIHEEVRRAYNRQDPDVIIGLLQGPHERPCLCLPVDDIVIGAPANEECRAFLVRRYVGERGRMELSELVIDRADSKVLFGNIVSRSNKEVVFPLGEHVIDRTD